jgi:hypothetical protein
MPDSNAEDSIALEVFGEGKTDIGKESDTPRKPDQGVVPILVYRLCKKPAAMRVKTKHFAHLERKKSLWQKVWFAKRQASYNRGTAGAVFLIDTEGDDKRISELERGRDHGAPDFPMAIGVARPCIEAWLLVDAAALRIALKLRTTPNVPDKPESLPPDSGDPQHPKCVLANIGAASQAQKDVIAARIDLQQARQRCPLSFQPFASEVETRLKPLFT